VPAGAAGTAYSRPAIVPARTSLIFTDLHRSFTESSRQNTRLCCLLPLAFQQDPPSRVYPAKCLTSSSLSCVFPCRVYFPACTTSILTYFLGSSAEPCGLGLFPAYRCGPFGYAEARPAPLREMHHLCSLARITYSEFGMTFDSNITARYAAPCDRAGKPPGTIARASTRSCTFMRSLSPPASPDHGLENYAPPSPLSAWDAAPPSPRSTRPCGAKIVSYPILCTFYLVFDPRLLLAALLP